MLCPACSREISDSARFCRHCRADLSEMGATSLSPLPAVAETVSVYCPACGVRISSTLRFCKSCGHRLATSLAERGGTAVDPLPLSRPIASPADSSPRVADPAPVTAEDEPFKAAPVEETWADPALAFDASPERTGAAWIVLITLLVAALGAGGWWWSQRQGFSDRAPLAAPAATPIPAVATPAAAPQPATVENTATPVAPVAPPAAPTVEANPPAAQTVAKKSAKSAGGHGRQEDGGGQGGRPAGRTGKDGGSGAGAGGGSSGIDSGSRARGPRLVSRLARRSQCMCPGSLLSARGMRRKGALETLPRPLGYVCRLSGIEQRRS